MEDSTYTPAEAARILKLSRRRVQQLLDGGGLKGYKDDSGRWFAYQWSVHQLLEERPPRERKSELQEWPQEALEALDEVKDLRYQLGRMEGRLELEAVARSTLEAQLQREQERADQERQERLEAQRKHLEVQEEARRLTAELETERSKGFWRRLFRR